MLGFYFSSENISWYQTMKQKKNAEKAEKNAVNLFAFVWKMEYDNAEKAEKKKRGKSICLCMKNGRWLA